MSRLAVIFDFDSTLAADSTTGFLESWGVDPAEFWRERVQRRIEHGWDPIPAYLYEMVNVGRVQSNDESRDQVEALAAARNEDSGSLTAGPSPRERGEKATLTRDPTLKVKAETAITRDALAAFGESLPLYPGVESVFEMLPTEAKSIDKRIEVEFYLISSGVGEILRRTAIAPRFRDIWACEFHYDDRGRIAYPRNIVSFTEKTRFLFQISKGLVGEESRQDIEAVNRRVRGGRFAIPIRNMIFVGDGMTDVPCFALVKRYGGHAIGVYDPHAPNKWGPAWELVRDERVVSIHQADYSPGSDLSNTLRMAVRAAAEAIRGAVV